MASSNRHSKTRKSDVVKTQKVLKHTEAELKAPTVVLPSTSRIVPKDISIAPRNMLASFGIKPAQRKQYSNNRDTKLKCCIIETPADNLIIFWFEPNTKKASSWSEKLLFDELKSGSSWMDEMNFDNLCYPWYDKLVPQQNNKGFAIRLFCINIETAPPSHEVLVSIGKHICAHINSLPDNKTTALVDEKDFIWIKDPTWVDIIGLDAATRRLKETNGPLHENAYV